MNTYREHLKSEEQSREMRNSGDFYYLIAEQLTKALQSKYMSCKSLQNNPALLWEEKIKYNFSFQIEL